MFFQRLPCSQEELFPRGGLIRHISRRLSRLVKRGGTMKIPDRFKRKWNKYLKTLKKAGRIIKNEKVQAVKDVRHN